MERVNDEVTTISSNDTTPSSVSNNPNANAMHPAPKAYSFFSFAFSILIILACAILFRLYIAAPYLVEGASMEDTFETYDYLIVDRLSYRLNEPQRGDVVVFHFPLDPSRTFIKRIIGLPGDTVVLEGKSVTIVNEQYPEGLVLEEPYVAEAHSASSSMTVTVAPGEYFVMGDNRKESADSRYWGPLPESEIVGRAFMRLYPLNSISILPGETRYGVAASTTSL